MKVKLKSWDELVSEFGSFINENNFDQQEIHLSNDDLYITQEYSAILGKKIKVVPTDNRGWIYFTREDDGHYICQDLIKK